MCIEYIGLIIKVIENINMYAVLKFVRHCVNWDLAC